MPDCAGRRLAPAAPCCGACPEEPAGAARVLRGRRRAGYNRRPMKTRALHVESNRPLLPPAILLDELPLGEAGSLAVSRAREEIINVLQGEDDRVFAVVGPCSVHDPAAALDYGRRLKSLADELADDLCVVMRVYFEKPRTTVGWKGLINDPRLD